MKIGICTTDFSSETVESLFAKLSHYGFDQVQFDFATIGEEEMPARIDVSLTDRILNAAGERQIDLVAINGTFNMIAPDLSVRQRGIERFDILAAACRRLGCRIMTLCTGTRDPENMWRWHPDNATGQAWEDMTRTAAELIRIAERHQVFLGVETEASNVVSTPELARRFLDESHTPYLKIIMDCANLFHRDTAYPANVQPTLKNAFDHLGRDIILAHGKDIMAAKEITFASPGMGIIDYDYFLEQLIAYRYSGGMLLHGIKSEADIPFCVNFIRNKIALHHL